VLVCHCEVVNDRRILSEIVEGALDCDAVAERCGAGSRCGGCRPTIEALLASLGLVGQPVA
jgi:bacterioferritin-associated ferredoxin